MAQILQGAGGTPVLDEDMLEKMRASGKAYAVEGEDPRIIQAGSVGNATIPMAQYITGTGPEIDLGYTYEPYIPEDKIADIMAKQKEEAEGDDSSNGSGSDGPPEPGEPGYEEYMMYNAGPDSQASDGLGGVGYTGLADTIDGGGMGAIGNTFQGGTYSGALNALGVTPYGWNQPMYEGGSTFQDLEGSGSLSAFTDGEGNISIPNVGPVGGAGIGVDVGGTGGSSSNNAPSIGFSPGPAFNYGGKVNKYGYGGPVAEQEDPYAVMPVAKPAPIAPLQGALAANQVNSQYQKPWYQQMGQAAGTSVMSNILMKGASMLIPGLGLNKGGVVCPCGTPGCPGCGKGYNDGGPTPSILRSEYFGLDSVPIRSGYRTSKYMPAELQEPVGDPTKHFSSDRVDREHFARADANPSMWKTEPGLDHRGSQGPIVVRIPSGNRTSSKMPAELQSPVGEGVLKQTGPLSIKNQIAIKESEAKIKREDMKAYADVYKKMKGPLQQGE